MEQTVKNVDVRNGYAMTQAEMCRLIEMTRGGVGGRIEALYMAFLYGYVLGGRAEKKAAKTNNATDQGSIAGAEV